ncbi:nucleotide exchange factor GrpE [Rhodophyticola porphyridii]|uniref:Protein GrpE n=1 Tax=Rhodophyticola porphyridii TaxID=1852017 RepID=A0A3L9Y6B8_9RHOB|nr:nucleotide exchange factor GrpE [Rhodophyticola porphyridii]RMA42818.1 nucleotide exchange factor GrpE [Rhodophyticola porphyridii]
MADPKEDPFLDDVEEIEASLDEMMEAEGIAEPEVSEVDALKAERDELKDRLLRVLADSENMRKRGERDRREAEQYGGSRLARDLLPVYDNLRRALDIVNDDQKAVAGGVIDGVELTLRELLNVFTKHGMTPIVPQAGDKFDPQQHQAMFEAPVPGTKSGEIIEVMAEGFMLHDRLLRPAQVGVSSMPAS